MAEIQKEEDTRSEQSDKNQGVSVPDLEAIGESPAAFIRTSLMVDSSKYTLIKLLAAFRMEEIRECLDEALHQFIDVNKKEIEKAVAWQRENEKRKKRRI